MNTNNAHTPRIIVTHHQNDDVLQNISEYVTAVLNGMEKAHNPETARLEIMMMRVYRVSQDKSN